MSDPAPTLRDLLVRASIRHGSEAAPASSHELARKAQAADHQIVYTTIAAILAGTYSVKKHPKRQTLEAIAHLAGVSFETVHEAAGLGSAPGRRLADQLPEDFDDLTLSQRDVLIRVGRALLDATKLNAQSNTIGIGEAAIERGPLIGPVKPLLWLRGTGSSATI